MLSRSNFALPESASIVNNDTRSGTDRGELLCDQRLDFVVAGTLVLELKSVEAIAPIHHSQLLSYLRVSKLRVGLLANFNVAVLKDGLVRKVL